MMDGNEEQPAIDRRPIITCGGELEVFSAIEDDISQALPREPCDWRRSLGRPNRLVHIGAKFIPFNPAALPKNSNQWDLIRQPLFHVYWTECTDIDIYKTTIKEDIDCWLRELTSREIHDYLIVVVENYDGKRANKLLPRTTVLDKIRADFVPKQGDRCISVINPGKAESKSSDSWHGLLARLRHLLLVAYNKAVSRLEDHVRQQRERRNEVGWLFMDYFRLQEELALVFEMLGLYDEALIQYDELDALFFQFVTNGISGESVAWLSDFQKPLERWHGLRLNADKLTTSTPTILELRSYLFAKQAQMLLHNKKVWEMASRCLSFLHTCARELTVLEISYPTGAVTCWLFLGAMEVLKICDDYNHADEVEDYSLHTASLWEYASQKLRQLGDLCGLTPGGTPTSEQLHIVVELSAGMGDNPGSTQSPSPTDKLKEALCSQDAFNKAYLELAELAMGTYKHIGRLRFARLVGKELASFYILLGETQKAAAFLGDAVRTFEQDKWYELVAQTQIELAKCYKKANDDNKFIRASAAVSAGLEIDTLIRWTYFDEMKKCLNTLDKPIVLPFKNFIKIVSVAIKNDPVIMQGWTILVELIIDSNFPREFLCTFIAITLENGINEKNKEKLDTNKRILTSRDLKPKDLLLQKLKIQRHLDHKQDKQLDSASVVCKHTAEDNKRRETESAMTEFNESAPYRLEAAAGNTLPLLITPGLNVLRFARTADTIGSFCLGQICIEMNKLRLVSPNMCTKLMSVQVKDEPPSVMLLLKKDTVLLSGIEQIMDLVVTMGSYCVDSTAKVKLTTSHGLSLQIKADAPLCNNLEFEVGERVPFTSTKTRLRVFAEMLTKDHQVVISCTWCTKPTVVNLSFSPPLSTTWRLHSVAERKFVQVIVTDQCDSDVVVEQPELKVAPGKAEVIQKCKISPQVIPLGSNLSCLWELVAADPAGDEGPTAIKLEFSLLFKINKKEEDNDQNKLYQYFFQIADFQSMYILEADVEPTKGSEFCRVGILCHLHIKIKRSSHKFEKNVVKSIMYEVLAEQSIWAIVGRTAGVVTFDQDLVTTPQTVVVDVMPLTSGYLPLPFIQVSKYIPAESGTDKARLEPFSTGQVYNKSKSKQVHVIASSGEGQS